MKRIYVSLLAALFFGVAAPAVAGEGTEPLQVRNGYLLTAEAYREKADRLEVKQVSLAPTQQWVAAELITVYDRLSELTVELVEAISADDRSREERLEQSYYSLKVEEELLWNNLEASPN